MLKQEIFDKTFAFILNQGYAGYVDKDGDFQCMYRDPDGRKCAAGFWITDEAYDKLLFEGGDASVPFENNALPSITRYSREQQTLFWIGLQDAHDDAAMGDIHSRDPASPETFRECYIKAMREFAKKHNLKFTIPDINRDTAS